MLDELFIRGGPVLFILFFISFLIFFILVNKYIFIYLDKSEWFDQKLDRFIEENPPESFDL